MSSGHRFGAGAARARVAGDPASGAWATSNADLSDATLVLGYQLLTGALDR